MEIAQTFSVQEAAASVQRAIIHALGEAAFPLNSSSGFLMLAHWMNSVVEDGEGTTFAKLARQGWSIYCEGAGIEHGDNWSEQDQIVHLCMEAAVRHLADVLLAEDEQFDFDGKELKWREWVTQRLDKKPEVVNG